MSFRRSRTGGSTSGAFESLATVEVVVDAGDEFDADEATGSDSRVRTARI